MRITARTRVLIAGCLICVTACAPAAFGVGVPQPCAFLTQTIAAGITGDPAMTNRITNVTEASGYVACVFTNPANEVDSVAVRIKEVSGRVTASTLQGAATSFARGEPVAPYQPFSVTGIGDASLGESTPGVAFVVFSHGDLVIDVGGSSAILTAASLRAGVESLARRIAAAL